ncbi:hypothetical protein C8R46DRAFT_1082554 [Mycena filopes]|nr:hypothetical protein C8R46DRAFT_1082554 [Mycena filopes]
MPLCSQCGFSIDPLDDPVLGGHFLQVATLGTSYDHSLTSNDPLMNSNDVEMARSIVSATQSCLKRVSDEIAQLRERIAQLEDHKLALSIHLAQHKALLSPLRRLPPEILFEIFSWTLPSILFTRDMDRFDVTGTPWVLGHISSNWRAVALSSPSLWSLVTLNYTGGRTNWPTVYPLAMIETQLARAQKLKIHFYGSIHADARAQTEMFQLLAAESARWKELSISLTPDLVSLLPSLRGRIPSLCRLWVQWDTPETQDGVAAVDCFELAPSLVDVGLYNEYRHIPIPLPVQQLTRYNLDAPWHIHETLLKLAQNLVEARIFVGFDDPTSSAPYDSEPIELPTLRRLYLSEAALLGRLKAHRLDEIVLYCGRDHSGGSEIVQDLYSFVLQSSCPLRRICLKGHPTTSVTAEILLKIPSVTEIGFYIKAEGFQSKGMNTLLRDFTVLDSADDEPIAPQLSCIFVGCDYNGAIDYKAYLEMVESRWKAPHCALTSAMLLTHRDAGPCAETLAGLKALRDRGLDLFLLNGGEASEIMGGWSYSQFWN